MKKIIVNPGAVFCIPLFMNKDDWKLKEKLDNKDFDKDFAFGRVIESTSSVLVEIFYKIGSAKTSQEEIFKSGVMFSPVQIFWDAVVKKRWKIIGETDNYNKLRDSNYESLRMAFGDGDFRLRQLSTGIEVPITREELKNYEFSVVWFPIDLENRIIKHLEDRRSCDEVINISAKD
jgi:hypothetical protein